MESQIICGDALTELRKLPSESVHCCISSPPYWGLRNYEVEGQLGLEKTPEEYVAKLVEIFREVKRVLRKDGTLWLNLGDSYCGGGRKGNTEGKKQKTNRGATWKENDDLALLKSRIPGLKPKNLVGIPWRVAFALQADGWWLRSDIIWAKKNCMPESVNGSRWERHRIKIKNEPERTVAGKLEGFRKHSGYQIFGPEWADCPGCPKCSPNDGYVLRMSAGRPTRSHEYIFLLTKSAKYYFDSEAVKEKADTLPHKPGWISVVSDRNDRQPDNEANLREWAQDGKRNIRSVWTMATKPFKEAHFATFPPELPERCIKAGTSEKGVCPKCSAPWVRVIEKGERIQAHWENTIQVHALIAKGKHGKTSVIETGSYQAYNTIGWQPSCTCDAGDPVPAVVLDPFFGAGTVGVVAKQLGRHFIGIELKQEYCDMAERRIAKIACQKSLDILLPADASPLTQT